MARLVLGVRCLINFARRRRRSATRPSRGTRSERGASLVALLLVLVLLGGLAATVLIALPSTSTVTPTLPTTKTTKTGGGTTPTTSRSIVSSAIVAECVTDYESILGAAGDYEELNGSLPPAGISWATTKNAAGLTYLHVWPSAPGDYTLSWSGSAVVVKPHHGPSVTGSPGTPSPPTGCYTT